MLDPIDVEVDVTAAADIGRPARTVVTVFRPDPSRLRRPAVVCFAFPGGGYSRGYFTFDVPGSSGGGQAGFHAERGWIFVACDSLGFGDSTAPGGDVLTLDNVAAGNAATVAAVLERLRNGTLGDDYPPVDAAIALGIGQSMGGCFTIVAQAQHRPFDGIALLGSSAIHTVVPSRPGAPPAAWPWLLRSAGLAAPKVLNQAALDTAASTHDGAAASSLDGAAAENPLTWAFHWDEEPADLVSQDMDAGRDGNPVPPWRSVPVPPSCALQMVAPGVVATEAAAITSPVLVAVGERDVVPNPWLEPTAYKSSPDISVFVCPRMAHMHNFAPTRERFWQRIQSWGDGVAAQLTTEVPTDVAAQAPFAPVE